MIINIVCEFLELECEACHKKGSYGEMLREKTCPFHPRPSQYDDDYMPHVFTCCTHDRTDGKHYNKDFTKQSGPYRWKKKWGPIHNGCQRREHTFELCLICQIDHKLKDATQKGGRLVKSYRSTKDGLNLTFSKLIPLTFVVSLLPASTLIVSSILSFKLFLTSSTSLTN